MLTGVSSYFNKNFLVLPSGLEYLLNIFQESFANNKIVADLVSDLKETTLAVAQGAQEQSSLPKSIELINGVDHSIEMSNLVTHNLLGNSKLEFSIPFFPQGLVLSFYGFLGLSFSFHLWFTLYWKIGGGFNEFNGQDRYVRLFRWGRPGKNRRIDLKYTNEVIEAIKVELNPRPALFLRVKGDKNIPLTRIGDFIPLEELEAQAAEVTSFMQIPLEMES